MRISKPTSLKKESKAPVPLKKNGNSQTEQQGSSKSACSSPNSQMLNTEYTVNQKYNTASRTPNHDMSQEQQLSNDQLQIQTPEQNEFKNIQVTQFASDSSALKFLRQIRSEAKLREIQISNPSSFDFNKCLVENMIRQRGYAEEKMVPIELFQEVIIIIEKRLLDLEKRIDSNEKHAQLSDQLMNLKYQSTQFPLMYDDINNTARFDQQNRLNGKIKLDYQKEFGENQGRNFLSDVKDYQFKSGSSIEEKKMETSSSSRNTNAKGGNSSNSDLQANFQQVQSQITNIEKTNKEMENNIASMKKEFEKKFEDNGRKLNQQFEKVIKTVKDKQSELAEYERRMRQQQEEVYKELNDLKSNQMMKSEETKLGNEQLYSQINQLNDNQKKLSNIFNELNSDFSAHQNSVKMIEDDLFVILNNSKQSQDLLCMIRNIQDDINNLNKQQSLIFSHFKILI